MAVFLLPVRRCDVTQACVRSRRLPEHLAKRSSFESIVETLVGCYRAIREDVAVPDLDKAFAEFRIVVILLAALLPAAIARHA